jgi:predicted ATPase
MGLSETAKILRDFVKARHRRSATRSANLELVPDHSGPPREDNYAKLCQLVKGVPEFTLRMLQVWHCASAGSTWTVNAVEVGGRMLNIPIEQVAVRLKLTEAAELLGHPMSYKQCMALYAEAQSIVLDNLVELAKREEMSG